MDSFHQFSTLPPELQLSIWEAANVSPSMHVFDLCLPGLQDGAMATPPAAERADVAFGHTSTEEDGRDSRYHAFKDTVFFDASSEGRDPSMYRWKMALASSCVDAHRVTSPRWSATGSANSVYLPGPDRRVQYDNTTDVLHLRLGPTVGCPKQAASLGSSMSSVSSVSTVSLPTSSSRDRADDYVKTGLLDHQWSAELAETMRTARYLALDAGQTNAFVSVVDNFIVHEEMCMLASTMACALEALYLVDYCSSGACIGCGHEAAAQTADWTKTKKGSLYRGLNGHKPRAATTTTTTPPPTRIYGVGMVYTQVVDLEGLGWTDRHPAYVFGKALGEAIREQQADAGGVIFQGVKVLVAKRDPSQ